MERSCPGFQGDDHSNSFQAFRGSNCIIFPHLTNKLTPNSTHPTMGLVKSVPGGLFSRSPSLNPGRVSLHPPPPIFEFLLSTSSNESTTVKQFTLRCFYVKMCDFFSGNLLESKLVKYSWNIVYMPILNVPVLHIYILALKSMSIPSYFVSSGEID